MLDRLPRIFRKTNNIVCWSNCVLTFSITHPFWPSKNSYKNPPNPKLNPQVIPLNIFLGRNDLILAKSLWYLHYCNTHSLLLAAMTMFSQDTRTAQTQSKNVKKLQRLSGNLCKPHENVHSHTLSFEVWDRRGEQRNSSVISCPVCSWSAWTHRPFSLSKLQSVLILQNDAQGFHSVDHFRKEILYNFSLDPPWILFGSSEGSYSVNDQTKKHWNKMLNVGGQDCKIKAVFWCGCDGCQTILECRT